MKNSGSLSRRTLLKAGISTMAMAPLAGAKMSLAQLLPEATPVDTTIPIVVGGRLLATSVAGVPPYVIESDRGTGFLPIYLRNAAIDPSLLGQHVTVGGTLTSGACSPPALELVNPTSPVISTPPSPFIPDCGTTLQNTPLTSQEAAALEQILLAYIGALFYNLDSSIQAMFADQATRALTDPTFANYIVDIPFISVEDDTQCPSLQCYSFSDFVDFAAAGATSTNSTGTTALAIGAVSDECLRKILIELLCFLLGLIVAFVPRAAVAEMERQATALLTGPRIRQAVLNIVAAAQRVIAGTFRASQFIDVLISAMHAMAGPLGLAFLAVIRTLRWSQYVLALAASAGVIIKAIIVIAKGAMFIWKLIDIVKTCLGSSSACPVPLGDKPAGTFADLTAAAALPGY
ncbi:MAG TPA: hypothetical protein VFC15_11945 [Candidatus Limnocylindrales bacterium]|nr:hypothetical protein [Candidatus Limnocylindrales bacterium]